MDYYQQLRGFLLDTLHDQGYVVFRYPTDSNKHLDDIVRVRRPSQLFPDRTYLILPPNFAEMDSYDIVQNGVTTYAGLDYLALFFEMTDRGVIVPSLTNNRNVSFEYHEFIDTVRRLPTMQVQAER
tara:strand:+ start:16197 stop:16574 length:378 start_codon:yes stop_codon:yes gene_type:complete